LKFELLIDSGNFWERLREDIDSARRKIYVQTLSFEGDSVGLDLAGAMTASYAPDKRIIVDCYTKYVISDRFLYTPRNLLDPNLRREDKETARMIAALQTDGTRVKFVNPVGPLFTRFAYRNHKKIIVVDDQISYIGGINFSEHNFAWHDMMLRIEDDRVALFLAGDFLATWEERDFAGRGRFGSIELLSLDGRTNAAGFAPLFDLIDKARDTIYVQSPYLTFPFSHRLRDAVARGVQVLVVTPEQNNKKALADYIVWEAARSGFDLRLYSDRMTHLKAMLIDNSRLIVGSSNFDYFSYRFEQETMAIVTDPAVIADFSARVIEADNAFCRPADLPQGNLRGRISTLQLRAAGQISSWFEGR